MALRAGELNKRITIQQSARVGDGGGGETLTWSTFATVWAKVVAEFGSERNDAQQVEASTSYTVTIRYKSTVTTRMRILFEGRVLAIKAVLHDGRRESTVLSCTEEDGEEGA